MTQISTKQAQVGTGQTVWFAYRNGQMLRDKRGVGRRFKTEEAARKAASKREPKPGLATVFFNEYGFWPEHHPDHAASLGWNQ